MAKPPTLADLLTKWHNAKQLAEQWTNEEVTLRKQIFDQEFTDPKRGQNKKKIEFGMALIGDYRLNYKIDRAGLEATLQSAGDNERAVIESVISYTPKVKDAAFEALSDDDKKLVGPFITVTPGTPGLEVKPQNKVRWS